MNRLQLMLGPTLALGVAAAGAPAATITLTDCTAPPVTLVGKRTVVEAPADDLVIQCALLPLNGQSRIEVTARSIVVDGDNGGSVAAAGKGKAVALEALGTGPDGVSIRVDGTNLTAANRNGNLELTAPGAIEVRGSGLQAGGTMRVVCTGGGCPITLDDVQIASNDFDTVAQGVVTVRSSHLATSSPLDRLAIRSETADVRITAATAAARGAASLVCRDDVLALCPGPDCPLPVTIASPDDAIAFCACEDAPPTEIETGIEGNVRIEAPQGDIDLRGSSVRAGENVDIVAADEIQLGDASVQNCGPKNGKVSIAGTSCDVTGATLLDDEPEAAPTLACGVSGTPLQSGTCSARR